MKDFFTQLKENLQNRPEPSPTESDWEKMQAKMNPSAKPSWTMPLWGWLGIPILALLVSNIWSFHRLNELEKNNELSKAKEVILKTDTIYISKNIYHSDTIYLTNTIYKTVEKEKAISQNSSPTFSQLSTPQRLSFFGKIGASFSTSNSFTPQNFSNNGGVGEISLLDYPSTQTAPQLFGKGETSTATLQKDENENALSGQAGSLQTSILSENLKPLPTLSAQLIAETQYLKNLDIAAVSEISQKKYWLRKKMNQLETAFRPSGFQLGVFGGYIYPIQTGLENQNGFSIGLQANVEFSKNLSMWVNGSYQELSYDAKRMGANIGIPVEESPNAEYTFEYARVKTPSFQYSVGMQYLFNADQKFKPLIGVGYGVVSLIPYEILYEFEKENSSGSDPEIIVSRDVETKDLLTNFILLRAGAQYQLTPRINFNLIGTYRAHTNPAGFSSPNLLNFQGGLMYKF